VLDSSRSNRSNLILFGRTFLKAINKLRRQKVNCSANLDILEIAQLPPTPVIVAGAMGGKPRQTELALK
jgi:hypothetical protein